jgi:Big-like domain-containing protein
MRSLRSALAGLILLGVLGLLSPPQSVAAVYPPHDPFCRGLVLRDYAAPINNLPQVRQPSLSGKLPFGPSRLSFLPPSESVVLAGDSIVYRVGLEGSPDRPQTIDWSIASRLIRVDSDGRYLRVAKRSQHHLGLLRADRIRSIGFSRSPGPGFYRFDISFEDRHGRVLGRYQDYFRVIRRSINVRLRLNGTAFQAGDRLLARIENFGAERLSYGLSYSIQRFDGARWTPVDLKDLFYPPLGFPAIALTNPPGVSSACSVFPVPSGLEPGHYRVVKSVSYGRVPSPSHRTLNVTAEFDILS